MSVTSMESSKTRSSFRSKPVIAKSNHSTLHDSKDIKLTVIICFTRFRPVNYFLGVFFSCTNYYPFELTHVSFDNDDFMQFRTKDATRSSAINKVPAFFGPK